MSYVDPESLTITVYPHAFLPGIDFTPFLRGVQITSVDPGGDGELRARFLDRAPHTDVEINGMEEVAVADASGQFRTFRIEMYNTDYWVGGARYDFVARGYKSTADDNQWPIPLIFLANTPVDSIYQDTLDIIPLVTAGTIDAAGRVIPADSPSFQGQTGAQIWEWAATQGASGEALTHEVVFDPGAGKPVLNVSPRHTGWDYRTQMADGARPRLARDTQQVFNRYYVKYEEGQFGRYVTVDDLTSQGTSGINTIRSRFLNASSFDNAAEATNLGTAHLLQTQNLRSVGGQIEIPYPRMVYDTGGNPVLPWRVNAGRNLWIEDLNVVLWIVEANWSEDERVLRIKTSQRNRIVEAVSRALKKKEPLNDPTNSHAIPHPATTIREQIDYNMDRENGTGARGTPYAPEDHSHGTPDGSISATISWDTGDAATQVPVSTDPQHLSMIKGTWTNTLLHCNNGGSCVVRVTLPDGSQFFVAGSDGATSQIGPYEVETDTAAEVLRQEVTDSSVITVCLFGTRNWVLSGNDAIAPGQPAP